MRSEDVVGGNVVVEVLEPALHGLLLAPRVDPGMRVPAQVVSARRPLRCAQLPVCGPRLVVDADYAAGGSLRRHEHSVADRAVDGHLPPRAVILNRRNWPSIDLLVTGHLAIRFEGAKAAPDRQMKPP